MIQSFKDKEAEKIFHHQFSRKLPKNIQRTAQRNMKMIHAAIHLQDLRVPPANHLEKLQGDRSHQYSIRINDQWRICFVWESGAAYDLEIIDYH